MEYAGITMLISARIGELFICNGKSVRLHNFREPIFTNNLKEAGHAMGKKDS